MGIHLKVPLVTGTTYTAFFDDVQIVPGPPPGGVDADPVVELRLRRLRQPDVERRDQRAILDVADCGG